MDPVSVLVVDDSPRFLRIVTGFLERCPEVAVVGTAANGEEALVRAEELRPKVIVLDLALPQVTGLEAIPLLRSLLPASSIVALTMLDADCYRKAALSMGADDFVPKAVLDTQLVPAILRAAGRVEPDDCFRANSVGLRPDEAESPRSISNYLVRIVR